jgi:hypothetical protein
MADMKDYLVGIVLFTFVIMGGMLVISEFNSKSPVFASDEDIIKYNSTFNTFDKITTQVDSLKGNIEDADNDFGFFGVLNSIIGSTWQAVKLFFYSFSFMDDIFYGMSTYFGVPTWVPTLIITLITIMIVFAIWSLVFNRDA